MPTTTRASPSRMRRHSSARSPSDERAVQQGDLGANVVLQPFEQRHGERDLGHEHERAPALRRAQRRWPPRRPRSCRSPSRLPRAAWRGAGCRPARRCAPRPRTAPDSAPPRQECVPRDGSGLPSRGRRSTRTVSISTRPRFAESADGARAVTVSEAGGADRLPRFAQLGQQRELLADPGGHRSLRAQPSPCAVMRTRRSSFSRASGS